MLPDRHQINPVPDSPPFQILLTNGSQDPSDTVTAATMTGFADKKRKNPFIEFMRFPKNMKVESQETRIGFEKENHLSIISPSLSKLSIRQHKKHGTTVVAFQLPTGTAKRKYTPSNCHICRRQNNTYTIFTQCRLCRNIVCPICTRVCDKCEEDGCSSCCEIRDRSCELYVCNHCGMDDVMSE